jgi:hypothetical protein
VTRGAVAAATALVMVVAPADTQAPVVRQVAAGPCNLINVNVYSDDLQGSAFEGFVAHPGSTLGNVTVENVKAYFTINIRTGRLQCSTDDSSSQVVAGARRKPAAVKHRDTDPLTINLHRGRTRIVLEATPAAAQTTNAPRRPKLPGG